MFNRLQFRIQLIARAVAFPMLLMVSIMLNPSTSAQTQVIITVDSLDDDASIQAGDQDGLITLREAVMACNTNAPFGDAPAGNGNIFDLIIFSKDVNTLNGTIQLEEQITISDNVRIEAANYRKLTINGGGESRIFRVVENASLSLKRATLANGCANRESGGAVLVQSGTFLASQVEITECRADYGGAISLEGWSTANIQESTLLGNWATHSGGAIYATDSSIVSLTNATITRNHANYNGGGLCLQSMGVTIDDFMLQAYASNSTIVENRTGFGAWIKGNGGGIAFLGWPESFDGKILFRNTIVANNIRYTYSGTTPDDVVGHFDTQYSIRNLIGVLKKENQLSPNNLYGSAFRPLDPRLGSLQGGYGTSLGYISTRCFRPNRNSPSIDNGDDSSALPFARDQRGQPRIRGNTVDIGSVER